MSVTVTYVEQWRREGTTSWKAGWTVNAKTGKARLTMLPWRRRAGGSFDRLVRVKLISLFNRCLLDTVCIYAYNN